MLKRLLFLVCLVPPAIVFAQDPEARWFDIEVIVFKRAQLSSENQEQWPPEPGRPNTDTAASLLPDVDDTNADPFEPVPFQLLPAESYQLNDALEKMLASDSYIPLVHLAWRQPTYEKHRALPILINGGAVIPQQLNTFADPSVIPPQMNDLEGTITVSVIRYLHLAAVLLLHDPSATTESLAAVPAEGILSTDHLPELGMRSYRLMETRRMRSTEVHYFDHPAFGILAVITPYKLPERPEPVEPIPMTEQAPESVTTPVTENPAPAVTP